MGEVVHNTPLKVVGAGLVPARNRGIGGRPGRDKPCPYKQIHCGEPSTEDIANFVDQALILEVLIFNCGELFEKPALLTRQ